MRLAALLLCGALALAACGGGGGTPKRSEADRVRDTLTAFAQASAKHDYRRVCADLLAKPVIDSVRRAGLSCESAMKTALQGVEAPKLEVRQVTIKGNRASAEVHTTAANQQASDDTVALVREGQDWKIGALSGG
jgi:ABC-type glycerol-3-phosphate transport system substrate-binding protein